MSGSRCCYARLVLALLLPLVGGAALAGCRRSTNTAPEIAVECRVEPKAKVGPVRAVVTLKQAMGREPVVGAKVRVEGDMSHPGMVPIFGDAHETQPGRYEAPLQLTMGGDWILTVKAELAGGGKLQRQIPLPGVSQ